MTTVIVLRGLPASGKTTWAKEQVAATGDGSVARINNDDLVASMFPVQAGVRVDGLGELLAKVRLDLLGRLIAANVSTVIVDNTNLNIGTVRGLEFAAVEAGADFIVDDRFLGVPVEECVRRDSLRDVPVGEAVITKMHKQATKLTPWVYTAEKFTPVVRDDSLPPAVIFDIDGTLAHKHPERDVYDGSLAHLDTPDPAVVDYARLLLADTDIEVIIMSGRGEEHRDVTEAWVNNHIGLGIPVFMRAAGDNRRDSIVKRELLEKHVLHTYNPTHVVDDRKQVVNMWRQSGIPCWQVDEGDF
jgi:predicted kinase